MGKGRISYICLSVATLLLLSQSAIVVLIPGLDRQQIPLMIIIGGLMLIAGWFNADRTEYRLALKGMFIVLVFSTIANCGLNNLLPFFFEVKSTNAEIILNRIAIDLIIGFAGVYGGVLNRNADLEKEVTVLSEVNKIYENKISGAKSEAELKLKEAEIDANIIINEAKLEAKLVYTKKDEFLSDIRALIKNEVELIEKLESED